jgi:hypothetical protein
MNNVTINTASENDIRSKRYNEIAGEGDWQKYQSETGASMFKSRSGIVRSIKSHMALYPSQSFVAYVAPFGDKWCGFYKVAA